MAGVRLILFFMRSYPWRSAVMVCCFLFSGIADGIGILTLLPIIDTISSGGDIPQSGFSLVMRQVLDVLGLPLKLYILLTITVIIIWTKGLFLFIAMRQAGYTIAHVTADLRLKLIRSLMSARWSYFVSQPAGGFANSISSESLRAASAYQHAILMIASLITMIVYSFVALLVSWKVTVLSILAAGFLMFLLRGFVKMSRNAGDQQTILMKSLVGRLTDALQGIKPIKAMAQEKNLQLLLEAETQELNRVQKRYVFASEALNAAQEPMLTLIVVAGLYLAVTIGNQTLSTLLVMIFLFNRLLNRFYYTQRCYSEMSTCESALWSLLGSIKNAEDEMEEVGDKLPSPQLDKELSLKSVNFAYGNNQILRNASLEITRGSFVSITGPSGAGKTTIVDLIVGLFLPQSGSVCIDGVPLAELDLRAWRSVIGYVPQEMLLLHESIYLNVTLGDDRITREDVEKVLRMAEAWDFVSSLPSGMDSAIGERGSRLSGGQRQRLSLARALARKPKLLILDEVTTSLDPKTEHEICETLEKLRGEVTILSISHQQSMIDFADRVFLLEKGCIIEITTNMLPQKNISTILG